jgi:hypothetical protein
MSIRKDYRIGTTNFECDECGETFEADGLEFHEAYDEYKSHGGVARLVKGEWEHRCEDCR